MTKKMSRVQMLKLEKMWMLRLAAINCQRGILGLAESFFVATKEIKKKQRATDDY